MKAIYAKGMGVLLVCFAFFSVADTVTLTEGATFVRSKGSPVTEYLDFDNSGVNGQFTLQIYNGGLNHDLTRVAAANFWINGALIVDENEFNQQVTLIERPITLLDANQLAVELKGTPEGTVVINIVGDIDNRLPEIASTPVTQADEDAFYSYQIIAADADALNTLTYSLLVSPPGMSIDSQTGLLTWQPTQADVGEHLVTLSVSDPEGGVSQQTFTLTVVNTNDTPVITSSALTQALEDALYSYTVVATDEDVDDTLTFALTDSPAGMTLNAASGLIEWLPDNDAVGENSVTVTVTDEALASVEQSFVVTVENVNDSPVFDSSPITVADEDAEYRYTIAVSDVDAGETLSLDLVSGPEGMTLEPSTGMLTWLPLQADVGEHPVTLSVTDLAGDSAEQSFTLTVQNVNDAPVFEPVEPLFVAATETLTFSFVATDEDDDVVSFSYSSATDGLTLDETSGELSWTPTEEQQGSYTLTVTATDGDLSSDIVVTIDVTEPPFSAPVFVDDSALTAIAGSTFSYTVELENTEGVTFSLTEAPEGIVLDEQSGVITWDAPLEGRFDITVKASVSETVFTEQVYQLTVIDGEQSHEGTDFWLMFGNNYTYLSEPNLYLYISSDVGATGNVTSPLNGVDIPFSVDAGQVTRVDLPSDLYNRFYNQDIVKSLGIHVVSDNKVTVYALNQKPDTMDGFLVLPTDTLSTEYNLMSYNGGQFNIVATEDNTSVQLVFNDDLVVIGGNLEFAKGEVKQVTLQQGETYSLDLNVNSGGSLAGTRVLSSNPVAVFTGSYCTLIPIGFLACDHIQEQQLPTQYWGTTYYTSPLALRFNGDEFRVLAEFENTGVYVNGVLLDTLDQGEWLDFNTEEASVIEATHPVAVAQFSTSAGVDQLINQSFGDPFMMMLTPQEQFVSQYQFTTTDVNIDNNLINVIGTQEAIASMHLDGNLVDAAVFSPVHDSALSFAQIELTEGAHSLDSDEPFSLSIYGFGETDSYGYQGGINLPRLGSSATLLIEPSVSESSIGEQWCVEISLQNGALPVINHRVDVHSPNSLDKDFHYLTDVNGSAQHCHYGLSEGAETVSIKAGSFLMTEDVSWSVSDASAPAAPVIVSTPIRFAKLNHVYEYPIIVIDKNANDTVDISLVAGPPGMTVSGDALVWSPQAEDEGEFVVEVIASDADGLSDTQSFTLLAAIGNQAPVVKTPLPTTVAYVGYLFNEKVEFVDPDGRNVFQHRDVYCEVSDNPLILPGERTNPSLCHTLFTFRPSIEDIGIQPIRVRLFDRSGGESFYDVEIDVRENAVPELVAPPSPYAKVGTDYSSAIQASDPDGDTLSYVLNSIRLRDSAVNTSPDGFAINRDTGEITFTPTVEKIGTYDVTVRVNDVIGFSVFSFPITLSGESEPFEAELSISPQFVSPNQTVDLAASVTGAASNVTYALTVNGETIDLDEDALATYTQTAQAGLYEVVLTATDTGGNVASVSDFFSVTDGSDEVPPVAAINAPAPSSLVTKLSDVTVTASDDNFAQWRLSMGSVSDEQGLVEVASGRTALTEDTAYSFDPTLLTNGLYTLQLDVVDAAGNVSTDVSTVVVDGNMKVGNFTYSVDEFTVPLAGLPITITRTYDTRRKHELGDFGYGWHLDYNLVKTEKSRALGAGWQLNQYASGPLGALSNFCVESKGDVLVTVTLPNDDVERFKAKASPECNEATPILDVNVVFEPIGDTQSTLTLKQSELVRLVNENLEVLGDSSIFDADNFVLTSREGYEYDFTAGGDVSLITDPNDNTLTFTNTGIEHSSGKKIIFSRQSDGKIASIRTPDNHSYGYTYSIRKDLTRARKPVTSNFEDYTYNYQHGLLDIIDSQGRLRVKNIYDNSGRLIAQEDTDGNRTDFTHDIEGKQSAVTDRNGHITFYYYDDRGNVTTMVDAENHTWTYTYDAQDNQLTETDPLNNVTTRTYNANNDLLTVIDAEGNETVYTYNARGQELTITDGNDNVYTNTYDAVGNLLSVEDPLENLAGNNINAQGLVTLMQDMTSNQTTFEYDDEGNKTKQTNADNGERVFTYDGDNQVATEVLTRTVVFDAEEGTEDTTETDTTRYTYDAAGRVITEQDDEGLVRSIAYDNFGNKRSEYDGVVTMNYEYDVYNRLTRIAYSDDTEELFTYDAEGNKVTETDRNGNVTAHTYDKLNRVVKTTYDDDSYIEMVYDDAGRLIEEYDERRNKTTYAYDKAGRRTSVTNALDEVTTFTFDANGNLETETDPLLRVTTYTYDALDRRTTTTFDDDTTMVDGFDAMGRNTSKTDQNTKVTSYAYDGMGRLVTVTDELDQVTRYEYDEAGNKVAQIDANGRTTRWEYDSRGRVTARELPLRQRETFTYDRAGNVKTHINFNGQTITYGYESSSSRLTSVVGPDIRESYRYDGNGNRTYAKNHSGEYIYTYDSRDRLIEEVQPNGATITYGYDSAGNKTSMTTTYANGDERTESYTYDALNRLASVTDNEQQTTTFAYDAVGNQTHIYYANGLVSITAYDELNRPTSVTTQDADDNVLTSYVYTLDNTGRRTSITEHSGRVSTFTYDDVYRLTAETIADPVNGDYSASYTYDLVGNRASSIINGVSTTYTYDDNDRLLSEGNNTYTYDDHGNVTEQSDGVVTKTYSYNANQRLMQFGDGTRTVDFEYNVDDIRVAKLVDGVNTDFIVDSNQAYQQVIAEQDASDSIFKEYLYGNDLISQNAAGTLNYFHYDSLGTTRALSDFQALLSDEYAYEAFGELLGLTGTSDNDYLFTGEQYDSELDNYYLRARYYNQGVGRFTQQDKWYGDVNTPITLNKYVYANSDAVNWTDPSGYFGIADIMAASRIQGTLNTITQIGTRFGSSATGRRLVWDGACFIVEELAEAAISHAIGLYVFYDVDIKKEYIGQSRSNIVGRLNAHFRDTRTYMENVTHILPVSIAPGVTDKLTDVLDALEQSFIDELDGPGGRKGQSGRSANIRNQINFKNKQRKHLEVLMNKFKVCD